MTRTRDGPSRRALLYGLAGGAVATAGVGASVIAALEDTSRLRPVASLGLDRAVTELLDDLDRDGPYRHPTDAERQRATLATRRVLSGAADMRTARMYARLGMDLTGGTDTTGRYCELVTSETDTARSWGLLAVDRSAVPAHLLVGVPHPSADLDTARIGLALFRAIPGSALLIAGAHRDAADGAADVAHERGSLFHALSGLLAAHGATQLQLHGYADDSMPDEDVVLSAGAGTPDRRTERAAEGLTERGLAVCRAWRDDDCDELDGETNVQGRAAAAHGNPFVHLELSRSTRRDRTDRAEVLRVLAETYRRDPTGPAQQPTGSSTR